MSPIVVITSKSITGHVRIRHQPCAVNSFKIQITDAVGLQHYDTAVVPVLAVLHALQKKVNAGLHQFPFYSSTKFRTIRKFTQFRCGLM
jgi:hypothetical protein